MPNSISALDMGRAKQFAKQSKSSFPQLSHTERLDYAAQQLFKARNYHELNKWRESTIQQYVIISGNIATCGYCGRCFAPDIKDEQNSHRSWHDAFEEAATALGYIPEQMSQREKRKKNGYAALSNGANMEQLLSGALDVLRGWFDRSLCSAISYGYWKQHPQFNTYVSYMVGYLSDPHFPQEVRSELESKFGRVDGVIEKGYSYWYPPN